MSIDVTVHSGARELTQQLPHLTLVELLLGHTQGIKWASIL